MCLLAPSPKIDYITAKCRWHILWFAVSRLWCRGLMKSCSVSRAWPWYWPGPDSASIHSAYLTLRNQRIAARDHGADVLTCVKAHQDLSAFCQFFALLPRFGHNPYWACNQIPSVHCTLHSFSALHVIFSQCTARYIPSVHCILIPSVHCTQAHKHSRLGCLQTNISSSPCLAPVSVSCCGQGSSPWDGTTYIAPLHLYTIYCLWL